jgi:hypothetical protein
MSENTRLIIGGLGAVGLFLLGLFAGSEVDTPITEPPSSPAVVAPCPAGWADTSATDEHGIVLSCSKDSWIVIVHEDGSFNYAWHKDQPGQFIFDKGLVALWPGQ